MRIRRGFDDRRYNNGLLEAETRQPVAAGSGAVGTGKREGGIATAEKRHF